MPEQARHSATKGKGSTAIVSFDLIIELLGVHNAEHLLPWTSLQLMIRWS